MSERAEPSDKPHASWIAIGSLSWEPFPTSPANSSRSVFYPIYRGRSDPNDRTWPAIMDLSESCQERALRGLSL